MTLQVSVTNATKSYTPNQLKVLVRVEDKQPDGTWVLYKQYIKNGDTGEITLEDGTVLLESDVYNGSIWDSRRLVIEEV